MAPVADRSTEPGWHEALAHGLVRRLRRPAERPGVIETGQAQAILARNLGMTSGLPLAEVLARRGGAADASGPGTPIVFARARPWPGEAGDPVGAPAPQAAALPVVRASAAPGSGIGSSGEPMVIQRKADPASPGVPAPDLPADLPLVRARLAGSPLDDLGLPLTGPDPVAPTRSPVDDTELPLIGLGSTASTPSTGSPRDGDGLPVTAPGSADPARSTGSRPDGQATGGLPTTAAPSADMRREATETVAGRRIDAARLPLTQPSPARTTGSLPDGADLPLTQPSPEAGPPLDASGLPLVITGPAATTGHSPLGRAGTTGLPGTTPTTTGSADQAGANRRPGALQRTTGSPLGQALAKDRQSAAARTSDSALDGAGRPGATTGSPSGQARLPVVHPSPATGAGSSLDVAGLPSGHPGPNASALPVVRRLADPRVGGVGPDALALPVVLERAPARTASNRAQVSPPPSPMPLAATAHRAPDGSAATGRPTPTVGRGPGAAGPAQASPAAAGSNGTAHTAAAAAPVDIDRIVDTVHRRFLRRLAVEGERRGVR